jgi:hypothetical protein
VSTGGVPPSDEVSPATVKACNAIAHSAPFAVVVAYCEAHVTTHVRHDLHLTLIAIQIHDNTICDGRCHFLFVNS